MLKCFQSQVYLLLVCLTLRVTAAPYPVAGKCAGFPAIDAEIADNYCLALIYQDEPLVKPRQILHWQKNYWLVTDMGGWVRGRGVLWLFDASTSHFSKLAEGLNLPHGLTRSGSDQILIGESDKIRRLTFDADQNIQENEVIISLTDSRQSQHPLTALVLDPDHNLLVSRGAPSDQCMAQLESGVCNERERAGVWFYQFSAETDSWDKLPAWHASGLRNPLALVAHPSGSVLAIDNGMDFDRVHLPFEPIVQIKPTMDYGWPYCHSMKKLNPDWSGIEGDCQQYDKPLALLPPHAAVLSATYYFSDQLPGLTGNLIVPMHGYQRPGYRILSVEVDESGLPQINKDQTYLFKNFNEQIDSKAFPAGSGASFSYLVSGWPGNFKSALAGITVGPKGNLWMVDDNNQAILMLTRGDLSQPLN